MRDQEAIDFIDGKVDKEIQNNVELKQKSIVEIRPKLTYDTIKEQLSKKNDVTIDKINKVIQNVKKAGNERLKKYQEDGIDTYDLEEFLKNPVPVMSTLSESEVKRRSELQEKAAEIQANHLAELSKITAIDRTRTQTNITIPRSLQYTGYYVLGENFINDIYGEQSKELTEEKTKKFTEFIKNMKIAMNKFSKKMSDEEYLDAYKEYNKYLITANEFQNNQIYDMANNLGVTIDENLKKELDDYKQNYSNWGVNVASNIYNRLGVMASPMYPILDTEDAIRLNAYMKAANTLQGDFLATKEDLQSIGTTAWDKQTLDNDNISPLQTYCTASTGMFASVIEDKVVASPAEVEFFTEKTEDSLNFYLKNETNEYTFYDLSKGANEQKEKYTNKELAQILASGQEILLVGKNNEMKMIKVDLVTSEIEETNKEIPKEAPDIKTVQSKADSFVKGVGKVNSVFFKNTTPAFDKMTKELNDLKKMGPKADVDKYMEGLQKAAKYAEEYLEAKKVDGKARTKNTEKRLEFAKNLVSNFKNCKNLQELSEMSLNKVKQNEKSAPTEVRRQADSTLMEKIEKSVSGNVVKENLEKGQPEKEQVKQIENSVNK